MTVGVATAVGAPGFTAPPLGPVAVEVDGGLNLCPAALLATTDILGDDVLGAADNFC